MMNIDVSWTRFILDEQQAKVAAHSSRDVNLAPITEDEELPTGNADDDEEVKISNVSTIVWIFLSISKDDEDRDEDEEGEDDEDEHRGAVRSRRPRPSGGSAERTSGGSGIDEENLDTDDNDATGYDDEQNNTNRNSTERTKVVSEEDADFMKAFDALVAESVAVSMTGFSHNRHWRLSCSSNVPVIWWRFRHRIYLYQFMLEKIRLHPQQLSLIFVRILFE